MSALLYLVQGELLLAEPRLSGVPGASSKCLFLSLGTEDSVPVPIGSGGLSVVPVSNGCREVQVPDLEGLSTGGVEDTKRDGDRLWLSLSSLRVLPILFLEDL